MNPKPNPRSFLPCVFCSGLFTAKVTGIPNNAVGVSHTIPFCKEFEVYSPIEFLRAVRKRLDDETELEDENGEDEMN